MQTFLKVHCYCFLTSLMYGQSQHFDSLYTFSTKCLLPTPYTYHNYLRKDKIRSATEVARFFLQIKIQYTKNGKLVISGRINSQ